MATKKEKIITIKDYIILAGVTPPSISYRIKNKRNLPGISRYFYDAESLCYKLVRDESIKEETIKDYFRVSK